MSRPDPIQAARLIVRDHFPACTIAILSGSIVKHPTSTSDLDLVIFDESIDTFFRKSFTAYGWPVEAVILQRSSYRFYFDEAIYGGIPSLLNMCAEGIVLLDDGGASDIIREAREDLARGPSPLDPAESVRLRYQITETLADFIGSVKEEENTFAVSRLMLLLSEFILRANRRWLGEAKWMSRCLAEFDANVRDELVQAVEVYYKDGRREPLASFAQAQLELYGGAVFDGYEE
ncbi:nucleotidyltransferase domain-containing protein [Paenibacillus hamazuiensis]|uniref:nucleotidyltransferase domain-containing protein n=1 Tax=Paenibacillus hamazuiensis TaxID=2936508 RepID=UPI00200DCC98|nr:nucleotidyltransferase domain-containing protein [Paenibacillus hamazuiensis]